MNTTPIREVKRIRAFIVAHPEMSPKNLYHACETKISKCAFRSIFENRSFTDPSYTRPPRRLEAQSHPWANEMFVCDACGENKVGTEYYVKRNKTKAYRIHTCRVCYSSRKECGTLGRPKSAVATIPKPKKPSRPASIDCKYLCPVCNMPVPMDSNVPFASQEDADQCCRKVALCR